MPTVPVCVLPQLILTVEKSPAFEEIVGFPLTVLRSGAKHTLEIGPLCVKRIYSAARLRQLVFPTSLADALTLVDPVRIDGKAIEMSSCLGMFGISFPSEPLLTPLQHFTCALMNSSSASIRLAAGLFVVFGD